MSTITPNLADLPPHQSSIDALKTITPNVADHHTGKYAISYQWGISYLVLRNMEIVPCLSLSLSLTLKLGRSTGRSTPHQLSIDALSTVSPNLADLPPSIEHRCLEYHYTKLGRSTPQQLSIDALHTITPNLADLPPSIKHRCLENHYTKCGRSSYWEICNLLSVGNLVSGIEKYGDSTMSLSLSLTVKRGRSTGRSTPHQLSMDALSTVTPNLADLPPSIKHRCLENHYTNLGRSTPPSN